MKKYIVTISVIISMLFCRASLVNSKAINLENEETQCNSPRESIVKILNNYGLFKSNGFVYKTDEKYSYIIASSHIVNKTNNYSVFYQDGVEKEAIILGHDKNNGVAVLRTEKEEKITPVCFANSNYIYKGQQNYVYGFSGVDEEFFSKTILSQIGDLYSSKDYLNVFKNVIDLDGSVALKGSGVFDELNRLIGMITDYDSDFEGSSYIVESNKLIKIADSIVKTGKYKVNYIKYNLVDYNGLSLSLKKSYDVSNKASSGVVIKTFKPINYLFGGLNQGFVIVAVNGVEIKNMHELDKQLARYEKFDNVCLKVIKNNGKVGFYHVMI